MKAKVVDIEVDAHDGPQLVDGDQVEGDSGQPPLDDSPPQVVQWTPEEAGHLAVAVFNFGILVWGPEWAAHPSETEGWNYHFARLLDMWLPKGAGGYAETGAGILLVGNGFATMAARRAPLIKAGPKPLWSRPPQGPRPPQPPPQKPSEPAAAAPASSPPVASGDNVYHLPSNLTAALKGSEETQVL
jgi:hypothetical protein